MRTRYHSAAERGVIKKSDTEELGIEKGKKMDFSPPSDDQSEMEKCRGGSFREDKTGEDYQPGIVAMNHEIRARKYGKVMAVLIGCPKKNFSTSDDQSGVEKRMGGCLGEDKTGRIIISETTQTTLRFGSHSTMGHE